MAARKAALAVVSAVVVAVAGLAWVDGSERAWLGGAGGVAGATASPAPQAVPFPTPSAFTFNPGPGVPADLDPQAPAPSAAAIAAAASAAFDAGGAGPDPGIHVRDGRDGAPLWSAAGEDAHVPGSVLKVFTAAAALLALGPEATAPTRVARGAAPGEIVLVGGGDMFLGAGRGDPAAVVGRAGLADLAALTAAALAEGGDNAVTLAFDDTLFAGPGLRPDWTADQTGEYVASVAALGIAGGRTGGGAGAPLAPDPAAVAAARFAALLEAEGIAVAPEVGRGRAPAGAAVLAEVRSAPVRELVAHQLRWSENTVSEVLGRLVAVAEGQPATFEGAAAAIVAVLADAEIDVAGVRLADCSGLSHLSAVPPAALTAVFAAAAAAPGAPLGALLTAVPVAGLEGTLAGRMTAPPAAGAVRAKTGSLTGVNSLAGTVQTAGGRLLVFAVIADQGGGVAPDAARRALDDFAARLAALP